MPDNQGMAKHIIVIGGGIAGLNAGIEFLQHGYSVSLYEKNPDVGGLCSGYFVDGYSIDACLHWLMGTKPKTVLNALWRNIDALNDDVEVSHLPYFCSFEYRGTKVTFGRNLDEEENVGRNYPPKTKTPSPLSSTRCAAWLPYGFSPKVKAIHRSA